MATPTMATPPMATLTMAILTVAALVAAAAAAALGHRHVAVGDARAPAALRVARRARAARAHVGNMADEHMAGQRRRRG
eukprot:scaffold109408_cov72-Phaeocystis_antarctica.AAC.6